MPDLSQAGQALLDWLVWFARQPNGVLIEAAVGLVILGIVAAIAGRVAEDERPKASTVGNQRTLPPVSTRGSRPRGPVYIPLTLGNVTIDLQPTAQDSIQTVVGGTSGLGKSTSVLPLLDLGLGVLIIALDNTRPIAQKIRGLPDGIEWTNEEGSPGWGLGLDLLSGRPPVAAEVLVEGWAAKTASDTGKWRDIATSRLSKIIALLDVQGTERNFPDLILAMMQRTGDGEADMACRDWARRLAILTDTIGPALGSDLELVQAMRARKKVLLRLNRFMYPRLAPMLGGMLMVHARRTMQEAGVPFVLIIEEAGQLEQYEQHMSPIFQAGRDRGVPVVLLTQNARRLKLEVQNNVSVWVSFAQEARAELDFAAERLRLDPEQLQREAFTKDQGRGWCYVRAPGMATTLVHVRQQKPAKPRLPALLPNPAVPSADSACRPRWEIVERPGLDGWVQYPRELPESTFTAVPEPVPDWATVDADILRMYTGTRRTGRPTPLWEPERGLWWDERGCLEWGGGKKKGGYGRSTRGQRPDGRGKDCSVHREFYQARYGVYPEPTYDHWCGNPPCADPEHGGPASIPDNNARRSLREAAFIVAWASRRNAAAERVGTTAAGSAA